MTSALIFAALCTGAFVALAVVTLLVAALQQSAHEGSKAAAIALLLMVVFGVSFAVGLMGASS